jgi:pimeloyl-ACP methyl ester carboxylesterase
LKNKSLDSTDLKDIDMTDLSDRGQRKQAGEIRGATVMKRLFKCGATIIVASWLLSSCAQMQWPLTEGQHKESYSGEVRRKFAGQFLLYLPHGFTEHPASKYPLLIFLHGSGESGFDIDKVKKHGPPQFLDGRPDFPFIVASPQVPHPPQGFDPEELTIFVGQLLQRLPIDKDRVYLTGFSMGGYGTYHWASVHPEIFAAIAPVSGAWNPDDACKLRRVPVWVFHGAKDETVKPEGDEAMVDAIKECGGNIKFTEYPDVGHTSDQAYADPELYQWLLQHRLTEALVKEIGADRAAREKRVTGQTPAANAEPTLRRLITDFSSATPDYSQMTSHFAAESRKHADKVRARLTTLGTLNALKYKGTEQDGSDVYDAEFENGRAQLRLLLQWDGKISDAAFDPGP